MAHRPSALVGVRSVQIDCLLFVGLLKVLVSVLTVFCASASATSGRRRHFARPAHGMPHSQPWTMTHPILSNSKIPCSKIREEKSSFCNQDFIFRLRAGGQTGAAITGSNNLEKTVTALAHIFWSCCKVFLPATVSLFRTIIGFYRALPTDAIAAQVGLVYCFAGGYYPTLFSALLSARQCGWQTMVQAFNDLADQAEAAIDAASKQAIDKATSVADSLTQTTMTVLKAVDPVIINTAVGALYATWLGVSTVLEREFARTIALSMSLAGYLRPITLFVMEPPLYRVVPQDYHQWVPVIVGWICKAAAMSVAWRIQRVFTCYTSAITGGLMFSRAVMRMLHKRFGTSPDNVLESPIEEVFGLSIAGLGMYSQMGNGFDFKVPYPLSLVLWPFDWAEKWIQWQITKEYI